VVSLPFVLHPLIRCLLEGKLGRGASSYHVFAHGDAQCSGLPPDNDVGRNGKAKGVHWLSMIRYSWPSLIRKVHGRLAAELWDAGCVRLMPLDGDAVWPEPNCQTWGTLFATRGDESSCIAVSQLGDLILFAKASFDD
jgi:hypothetical protein